MTACRSRITYVNTETDFILTLPFMSGEGRVLWIIESTICYSGAFPFVSILLPLLSISCFPQMDHHLHFNGLGI